MAINIGASSSTGSPFSRIQEICTLHQELQSATDDVEKAKQVFSENSELFDKESGFLKISERDVVFKQNICNEKMAAIEQKTFNFVVQDGDVLTLAEALYPNNKEEQGKYMDRVINLWWSNRSSS